jgi:transcriptional regulator with XRE-family HTH domain
MAFYHRLEPLLSERKMSQKDLAEIAGVTPPSVFEWKNEGTMPRADTAIKIADYFNVSVKWLILGEKEKELTQNERNLIDGFRKLDSRDQDDVLGIVEMKIENAKKGDILSNIKNA